MEHFVSEPSLFPAGELLVEGLMYTSGFLGSTMGETVVADIFMVPTVLLSRIDDGLMGTVTMTEPIPQVSDADLAFVDSAKAPTPAHTTGSTVDTKDHIELVGTIDMKELTAFINSNKRKSSKSRKRVGIGKRTATAGEDAYIDAINN